MTIYKHTPGCRRALLIQILLAAAFLLTAVCRGAAPPAEYGRRKPGPFLGGAAMMKYGTSPRVPLDAWVSVDCRIFNTGERTEDVLLTVKPEGHDAAIYQEWMRIGRQAGLSKRLFITSNNVETYEMLLTNARGEDIGRDEFLSRTMPPRQETIFVINDDIEYTETSQLRFRDDIVYGAQVTYVGHKDLPLFWAGFGRPAAVIVAKPDYDKISQMQYNALLDYVARGGSLLFILPESTMAAARTPLAALLPVFPMRISRIEALPEIDAWGAEYRQTLAKNRLAAGPRRELRWPEGADFLESEPVGEGVTTAWRGGIPLIRWQRHGLGTVGFTAFNPCVKELAEADAFVPLWNHLLAWCRPVSPVSEQMESREPVRRALQLLTGFSIPSAGLVKGLLGAYVGLVVLILAAGFLMRRQVTAWMVLAGIGVFFTLIIFHLAFRQGGRQDDSSGAAVRLQVRTSERCMVENIVSLFSRNDGRPTFSGLDYRTQFRRLTTPMRSLAGAAMGAAAVSREEERGAAAGELLRVQRRDGVSSIPELNIQALKARRVVALSTLDEAAVEMPKPGVLRVGRGLPVFDGCDLPAWVPKTGAQAYLLLENGFLRSSVRDGRCAGVVSAGDGLLQLNTTVTELEALFGQKNLPRPALALVYPHTPDIDARAFDFGQFRLHGYTVEFLPLQVQAQVAADLLLTPEMVEVEPDRHSGRTLRWLDAWASLTARDDAFYEFTVKLPPWATDLEVEDVVLEIDISNPGGNVTVSPVLAAREAVPADIKTLKANQRTRLADRWEAGCKPTEAVRSRFRFQKIPAEHVRRRGDGLIALILRVAPKIPISDPVDAARANVWQMNSIKASVSGRLPGQAEQRKF